MSITLVDVAGANFRTDQESDDLNTQFMSRLGMKMRSLPARLAVARSLSIDAHVVPALEGKQHGKIIKGDALFGTSAEQLSAWLALIVEHSGELDVDIRRLVALVGAHWKRGLDNLDEDWRQADEDIAKFVKRLAVIAELAVDSDKLPLPDDEEMASGSSSQGEIRVQVGENGKDVDSNEDVFWSMNSKGGSPHSAIMGKSGSGKTVLAAAMLRSIREQVEVPLIAFDFKGDLYGAGGIGGQQTLGEIFKVEVIEPPKTPIPLDVLSIVRDDSIDIAVSQASMRFRDSFSRLKSSQLGDIQRTRIYEAANRALSLQHTCELKHILDELMQLYEENDVKKDGAISIMEDLCRFPLFSSDLSPEEFFRRSWIIKMPPNVPQDIKTIVVNLFLDALDQHLNGLADSETDQYGARDLRLLCMIDEAHQILGTRLPSLANLIRMSRSKGGAVMLVSQSPDDFSGEDDEFLDNMGFVAAFATNAKPRAAQRVLGRGANLIGLQEGECYARVGKTTRKIRTWEHVGSGEGTL